MVDHKLVCSARPVDEAGWRTLLRFFRFYAHAKGLLNILRGQWGPNGCEGWIGARDALACAQPRLPTWRGPSVGF